MAKMARRARTCTCSCGRAGVGGVGARRDEPAPHGDVVRTVGHRLHGGAEDDALVELGRHALGQLLGAAREAPLLRAARRAGQVGQTAAGVEVEEREEERELARARAEDGLDRDLEDGAGRGRGQVGVEVGGERLRIEGGGIGGVPGRVDGHLEGGEVQIEHAGDPVGGALGVRGRDEPDVEVPPSLAQLDPLPLGEGGKGGYAHFGRQRGQVVLGRADPLPAPVDRGSGLGDLGEGASADAVAGLEHQDVDAGAGQVTGGGQARVAGPDDHHLALAARMAPSSRWGIDDPVRPR